MDKRLLLSVYISFLISFFNTIPVYAQSQQEFPYLDSIDYTTFLKEVGENNLAYSVEKFELDIAEAEIMTAGLFADPELELEWYDNGHRRMKMGYGFEANLSWDIELGGKRKARIHVAKDEVALKSLLLKDYYQRLRSDATLAYMRALASQMTLESQKNILQQVQQWVQDEQNELSASDKRTILLEESYLLNGLYAAEADWMHALSDLSLLLGSNKLESMITPTGNFSSFVRDFNLQELITTAQNNRTELKIAIQDKNLSKSLLALAQADRALDLGVFVGVEYGSYVNNTIGPSAAFTSVHTGVSIPLKFSNKKSGDLKAAQLGLEQSNKSYQQIELEIQTEVMQAYWEYQSIQKQLNQFETKILPESKTILEEELEEYTQGESSLLDAIEALKEYHSVQAEYHQLLFDNAESLINLEQAAGIWSINF